VQAALVRRRGCRAVIAVLALGGALAFALLWGGGYTAQAAAKKSGKQVALHAKHPARANARRAPDPVGAADTDEATSSETESSVESEQGQPGEPANGHADGSGTVDHQCDGNCVE
jgi:hypothetical protein